MPLIIIVFFKDSQSTPYVASNKSHVCRPLSQSETLEIVWTAYPPEACDLQDKARSRWIRPVVGGKEAYALLGEQNKEGPIMWTFLSRRRWKWCSFATPVNFIEKDLRCFVTPFLRAMNEYPFYFRYTIHFKVTDILNWRLSISRKSYDRWILNSDFVPLAGDDSRVSDSRL